MTTKTKTSKADLNPFVLTDEHRVAKAMVDSLMDSRSIPALEEGAKFLDAMDRPAQATGLRVEADRLRAKA